MRFTIFPFKKFEEDRFMLPVLPSWREKARLSPSLPFGARRYLIQGAVTLTALVNAEFPPLL